MSMAARIMGAIESLQSVPHRAELAQRQAGLKYLVRSLAVRPYIIYFRAIDDEKVVRDLRIRHGARRALRKFE
jgi:plasmid stabilization system protein ParE